MDQLRRTLPRPRAADEDALVREVRATTPSGTLMTEPPGEAMGPDIPDDSAKEPNARRQDIRRSLPPWLTRWVWAVAIIVGTALVFGGASFGLSSLASPQYSASATVLIQPDPSLAGLAPDQADGTDRFDQTEVVALQTLVANTLPRQRPTGLADLSITQVGLTDVLQITASAPVAADAVASANLLLDDYVSARRSRLLAQIKTAVAEVNRQLATITQTLRTPGDFGSATAKKAVTAGLTAEYGRLVSLRNQTNMVAATADSTTVLSRATANNTTVSSNKTRNAVLAGLLGALAALGVLVFRWRATAGRPPTHRLSSLHS